MTSVRCPSGGVVKCFQIACNLAGPLGDLTGRGDQPSGKVVHKDCAEPLGDLTGRGDQPRGKVVLVSSAVHIKETFSKGSLQQEEDAQGYSQVGQTGIVKIHITL